MTCPYTHLAVLATLAVAGCSTSNPVFGISSASDSGGSSGGAGSTGGTASSDPAMSTTRPETEGSETGMTGMTGMTGTTGTTDSSHTATSVDPGTDGSSDSGGDTGSSSGSSGGVAECGDGSVEPPEACDDGNQKGGDGCAADCTAEVPAKCGDGLVDGVEQCDAGANNGPNKACLDNCMKNVCGDGDKGPEEACDLGANNDVGPCTKMCEVPVCGDGVANGDESCDSGPDNGALGKCSEDCSAMIPDETLMIKVLTINNLPPMLGGNFNGNTGIAGGDNLCKGLGAYKILASDGVRGSRIATVNQYVGDGQQDWVLMPHRGYANAKGELIFVTGGEALLGVRKQAPVPLIKPIGVLGQIVWTGLNKDWTPSVSNCTKWTTKDPQFSGATGVAVALDGTFFGSGAKLCSTPLAIYCVQQPAG